MSPKLVVTSGELAKNDSRSRLLALFVITASPLSIVITAFQDMRALPGALPFSLAIIFGTFYLFLCRGEVIWRALARRGLRPEPGRIIKDKKGLGVAVFFVFIVQVIGFLAYYGSDKFWPQIFFTAAFWWFLIGYGINCWLFKLFMELQPLNPEVLDSVDEVSLKRANKANFKVGMALAVLGLVVGFASKVYW